VTGYICSSRGSQGWNNGEQQSKDYNNRKNTACVVLHTDTPPKDLSKEFLCSKSSETAYRD
jgi:hypothetical protein